jgi:hypothetical protein
MKDAKPATKRIPIDAKRLLGVSASGRSIGTEKQGVEKGGCKEHADKTRGAGN